MDNVTAAVVLLVTLLMGYFLIRNELVFRFTTWLNHRCYEIIDTYLCSCGDTLTEDEIKNHRYFRSVWDSITNIPYAKMLFSFKPLKPEYWLTEEQQDFLNRYNSKNSYDYRS